jgi:cation diffusion facilitator CzcD-associated flavoprotein CzcO
MTDPATRRLAELSTAVHAELKLLAYPDRGWTTPAPGPDGEPLRDVIIVGGGQSGLAIAHGLRREGVTALAILDRAPAGSAGVWNDFARMSELRTPKALNGMDFGLVSLSVQRWFAARHGEAAWEALGRISRADWTDYLTWYRTTLGLDVESETMVLDVRRGDNDLIAVDTIDGGAARTRHARTVVLATGYDGAGSWRVPDEIAQALPPGRCDHSNGPIDFARHAGQRLAVIGHGASAFDSAAAALRAGAASVDLLFRRARLPTANPHRQIETAGLMTHYSWLPDALRWRIARHFRRVDQPPAEDGFRAALALPGFRMHAGSPILAVGLDGQAITLRTPQRSFTVDHVIAATGLVVDLAARPELKSLAPKVACWRHRHCPAPGEEHAALGAHPYLGAHYEFEPLDPAEAWIRRVFAFNGSAFVSQGPHSTSNSGHKHAVPRLLRGVTRALFLAEAPLLFAQLQAYDAPDLVLPDAPGQPFPTTKETRP